MSTQTADPQVVQEPTKPLDLLELLNQMWQALNPGEQEEALRAFWTSDQRDIKNSRERVTKPLAEALRFREVFVSRAPVEKKVQFLKRALPQKPFRFRIRDLVRAWLWENRRPLLKAFLDACSIPNDNGLTDSEDPPTVEQFEAGITAIIGKFPQRDIALYLMYVGVFSDSSEYWGNLVDAPSFDSVYKSLCDPHFTVQSETEELEETHAEPESDTQGFTTLDDHLIRSIVASAFGEEGALPEDAVEDLVEEVVEMNSGRHRTLFHRGFFHALFGRAFTFHFPAENSERRQWYLSGVIFGLLRHNQNERCVEIFAVSQKDIGEEILASQTTACGPKLLPLLYLPLLMAGHLKPAVRFIQNQFPRLVTASQRLLVIEGILQHGSRLLREGKSAEAEPLFDLLQELIHDPRCAVPHDFKSHVEPRIKRRKAQCLQAKGSFAAAKAMLSEFSEQQADEAPYKALTDLALVAGGFRSLAAVLPKSGNEQNKALVDGLRKGRGDFEKAIAVGGEAATNAHFAIGILLTLESPTQFAQERADRFQTALGGMLEDSDAYAANGILEWTRFLLALALLETAEPSNFLPAADLIPAAIDIELRFPAALWERMFDAAALFDDSGLAILIGNYLMSCREEATDCLMANPSLLARNEDLFKEVLEKFLSRKTSLRKCWSTLEKLLPEALGNHALEVAGTILDRMEALAISNKEFRKQFIVHLADSDRYSPAWETADAQDSLVTLLEIEGNKAEAVEILRERFFQIRGAGASHREFALRQVLERLNDLHADPQQFEDLSEILTQYTVDSAPADDPVLACKVLYIGGNETQESYEGRLRREFSADHPQLSVQFYFPGWSSNWNVHLAKLKPMIDVADVVVINPLIRTQLGRHLRAYCGSDHPWLPCTGRGYDSLKRSILNSAKWSARFRV